MDYPVTYLRRGRLDITGKVYISGEEMTAYCMQLIRENWINPYVDTSSWQFFDLSCHARDASGDQVQRDAVEAGGRVGAIFKEPTITPNAEQSKNLGLRSSLPSPNGAMRRAWRGVTISRDTLHITGLALGYARPVLFDRHAVGGEYEAGHAICGPGTIQTYYTSPNGRRVHVDSRTLTDTANAVVTYHNPLDNVSDMARIFFERCLMLRVTPYIVTKKTVFKWQEDFWVAMKRVFDAEYKHKFADAQLLPEGELVHLLTDAAAMHAVRCVEGGWGMAAHNYDGDVLTDAIAQVHGSPSLMTSALVGKSASGSLIKQYEAVHGTAAGMWRAHLAGNETSLNPLGMAEALIEALLYSVVRNDGRPAALEAFCRLLRRCLHLAFASGLGTRDVAGPSGLTTERFVELVAELLERAHRDTRAGAHVADALESVVLRYKSHVPAVTVPSTSERARL